MAGRTLAKGRQTGAHYEIKTIADIIRAKEKNGHDATYEREILKAWAKYPGYESAKKALEELNKKEENDGNQSKGTNFNG